MLIHFNSYMSSLNARGRLSSDIHEICHEQLNSVFCKASVDMDLFALV